MIFEFAGNHNYSEAIIIACCLIFVGLFGGYSRYVRANSLDPLNCDGWKSPGPSKLSKQITFLNSFIFGVGVALMLVFALYELAKIKNPVGDDAWSLGMPRNSFGLVFVVFLLPILHSGIQNYLISDARNELRKFGFECPLPAQIYNIAAVNDMRVPQSLLDSRENCIPCDLLNMKVTAYADDTTSCIHAINAILEDPHQANVGILVHERAFTNREQMEEELKKRDNQVIFIVCTEPSQQTSNDNVVFIRESKYLANNKFMLTISQMQKWENVLGICRNAMFNLKCYYLFRTVTMILLTLFFAIAILPMDSPLKYAPTDYQPLLNAKTSVNKSITGALQFFHIDPAGIALLTFINMCVSACMTTQQGYVTIRKEVKFVWWRIFLQGVVIACIMVASMIGLYVLLINSFETDFGYRIGLSSGLLAESDYTSAVGVVSIMMWCALSCMSVLAGVLVVPKRRLVRNASMAGIAVIALIVIVVLALWWPFHGTRKYYPDPSTRLKGDCLAAFFAFGWAIVTYLIMDAIKFAFFDERRGKPEDKAVDNID